MNQVQIKLKDKNEFSLKATLTCGQCFRYRQIPAGNSGVLIYRIIAGDKVLYIKEEELTLTLYDTDEQRKFEWIKYFSLDEDYEKYLSCMKKDMYMNEAIDYAGGLRILKQDPFEMLITFILSQNNNIKRIAKNVEDISEAYGKIICKDYEDGYMDYAFPTPEALAEAKEEDLRELKLGYRAEYVLHAAREITRNPLFFAEMEKLSMREKKERLLSFKGIGSKVADCILLFGFQELGCCPHDVWVKRIFSKYYHLNGENERETYAFAKKMWGEYAGIAQEYLYYYERNAALGKGKNENSGNYSGV